MLEELDLLQQNVIEEDAISLSSLENMEMNIEDKTIDNSVSNSHNIMPFTENIKSVNSDSFLNVDSIHKISKHVRSFSDITDFGGKNDNDVTLSSKETSQKETEEKIMQNLISNEYNLSVEIIETGIQKF